MTASEFRQLALTLPDASEGAHMGHPDSHVVAKIFATLGPREAWCRCAPPQLIAKYDDR